MTMSKPAPIESGQPAWGLAHGLRLPSDDQPAVAAVARILASGTLQRALPPPGPMRLEVGDRTLKASELQQLATMLAKAGLELVSVASSDPATRVTAAGLGLAWEPLSASCAGDSEGASQVADTPQPLTVHQGTVRSGDHVEADGTLLVLGDVNPGARIAAAGHVLVWGQLRGVAHAGSNGDRSARIVALQLRPVQLRIADLVARGPAEAPPRGLAEQAVIESGTIAIQPAQPQWPLWRQAAA